MLTKVVLPFSLLLLAMVLTWCSVHFYDIADAVYLLKTSLELKKCDDPTGYMAHNLRDSAVGCISGQRSILTLGCLLWAKQTTGQLKEAEALANKHLLDVELGPSELSSLHLLLAEICRKQDKLSEAEFHANEGIRLLQLWCRGENPELVGLWQELVSINRCQKNYIKADKLCNKSVEMLDASIPSAIYLKPILISALEQQAEIKDLLLDHRIARLLRVRASVLRSSPLSDGFAELPQVLAAFPLEAHYIRAAQAKLSNPVTQCESERSRPTAAPQPISDAQPELKNLRFKAITLDVHDGDFKPSVAEFAPDRLVRKVVEFDRDLFGPLGGTLTYDGGNDFCITEFTGAEIVSRGTWANLDPGATPGHCVGLCLDEKSKQLYALSDMAGHVVLYSRKLGNGDWQPVGNFLQQGLTSACGLTLDADGMLYSFELDVELRPCAIIKIDPSGTLVRRVLLSNPLDQQETKSLQIIPVGKHVVALSFEYKGYDLERVCWVIDAVTGKVLSRNVFHSIAT